ncbi:hypothetical protein GCM10027051_05410 [Niabella terrae]
MKRKYSTAADLLQWGRALQRAGAWLERKQRRFAGVLNRKCADLSSRSLVTGLVCFCLFSGWVFGYIIWDAFSSSKEMELPEKIELSRYRIQGRQPQSRSEIELFRIRPDSLRNAPNADSIFRQME